MSPTTQALPTYLKKYSTEQKYDAYTSRDQAAWRYIMRQNRAFFAEHAVSIYLEGLKKTGVSLERIPRISEMDDCLAEFGWGAVPVTGFIPPAAFLDFQARGVLPIACDMRSVNHIAYTPAPDIVHEAAGHAPILAEPAYAKYLHHYARMAQKAIPSAEDIRQYEAIRYLSDIKENPDTAPGKIAEAEARLKDISSKITHVSEAAKVARMAWWTVEYGLVGDVKSPRIYGAGLLSSVGESQNCLSNRVKKIPLSVDCVETSYDITEPQPQLFVTPNMEHLTKVLRELEKNMAFTLGGEEGLRRAKQALSVNTFALSSGLEVSGQITEYLSDSHHQISFVKCSGPVQLCFGGTELAGQGRDRHATGFSTPVGAWSGAPKKRLSTLTDGELAKMGLERGKKSSLKFTSGIEVTGTIVGWHREKGQLLFITWRDCTVRLGGKTLFDPSWGEFDMGVGESVDSVFGGPADRGQYGELDIGSATTSPARSTPYSKQELSLFDLYAEIRKVREEKKTPSPEQLGKIATRVSDNFPQEWLLSLELLEIAQQRLKPSALPWVKRLQESLHSQQSKMDDKTTSELIAKGLILVNSD